MWYITIDKIHKNEISIVVILKFKKKLWLSTEKPLTTILHI